MAPLIKMRVETMKKACWIPTQGTLRGAEGADSPWKEWGQRRGLHRKGEMDKKFQVRDTAEKADQGPLRITVTPPTCPSLQALAFPQTALFLSLFLCLSSNQSLNIRVKRSSAFRMRSAWLSVLPAAGR